MTTFVVLGIILVYGLLNSVFCSDENNRSSCIGTNHFGRNCSLSCHCLDSCHGNGSCEKCAENWAGPTCQIKLGNVAVNKTASQGPTSKSTAPASLAVDGSIDGPWTTASLRNQYNVIVWWSVNLGDDQQIYEITVYYRPDEKGFRRRRGHTIWISNVTDPVSVEGQKCFHDNGEGQLNSTLHIGCQGLARYVRIHTIRNETQDTKVFSKWGFLELVEVVVQADQGCSNGTYGDYCEHQCGHCLGTICDRDAGYCDQCEPAWKGDTCMEESCPNCNNSINADDGCKPSWHGVNCSLNCLGTCLNNECDVDTGLCSQCPAGFTGQVCNETCPDNCAGAECTIDSKCTEGCKEGFYGDQCTEPCSVDCLGCYQNNGICKSCQDGKYGDKCENDCHSECRGGKCDREGHCTSGCTDMHYYGEFCDQECSTAIAHCDLCLAPGGTPRCLNCSNAKYGEQCEKDCPVNCELCTSDALCTQCKSGTSGTTCNCTIPYCLGCDDQGVCAQCEEGRYGPQCNNTCPVDCKTCTADPSGQGPPHCQTCKQGSYLDTTDCVQCPLECKSCNSSTYCSECIPRFYGVDCQQNCSGKCLPDSTGQYICDKIGGVCSADCVQGYYGDYCNNTCSDMCGFRSGTQTCNKRTGKCTECKKEYYGESCDLLCSGNCLTDSCHRKTGWCEKCKGMFYTRYCNVTCPLNCESGCEQFTGKCETCKSKFYGQYCNESCPENCGEEPDSKKIVCHRSNAECLYCSVGFYGERCTKYCESLCARVNLLPNCEKSNGYCKGCQDGYHGNYCKSECKHCMDGRCEQTTGECVGGCKPGWFRKTCTERCNHTCQNEECDQVSGVCLSGCVDDFTGQFCERSVAKASSSILPIIIGVSVPIIVILIAVIIFIIIWYHYKSKRRSSGRGMPLTNIQKNGSTREQRPLIQPNGSTIVNELPLPKKNPKLSTNLSDDDLLEQEDMTPLVPGSTDPSDYYNLSWPIQVSEFPAFIRSKREENPYWYKEDFNNLPKGLLKKCNVAMDNSNRGKCRYKQLYPYDDNRVKLDPDSSISSDFINASYINGYKKPQAFIAAQGPTDVNLNDFWRMIWQKDCGKIVMLTNLFEECKMKCVRYWPEPEEGQDYGDLEVVLNAENIYPDYTLRHLQATNKITKEVKDFVLFHFTAWPDRGVPDNPSCMLNFRSKVMEEYTVPNGPILVHCSAGIGRTGTFVALDVLLRKAVVESHIDVFRTITDMRYQRTNFVQTDVQYDFLHRAIAEALTTQEMEIGVSEFCTYYWGLLESNTDTGNTKLQEQYEMLNQMSPVLDESFYTAALKEENLGKSRYPDVLPVDMYRAYLSTPTQGSNEYVNAVFLPTALNKTGFLLTQMPLPHTVTDFWRLVYDQHATTIVMMNNLDDNDESIGEYWPSDDCTYGPFKVELLNCENFQDYSTMSIQLTYNSTSRQYSMPVKMYRFESWPSGDMVPPSTFPLTALIGAVTRVTNNHSENPTIVHCMNGADRSGLYCVLSAIFERLQSEQKVNIPQTILHWRHRRPQLIPTLEQFDFCYKAVAEYLDSQQIYSNVI